MTEGSETRPELAGDWQKLPDQPDCAAAYPDSLHFGPGTYRGVRGEGQGFVTWDAGIYRVEEAGLVLSTATDELVTYDLRVDGDVLTVVDRQGCRFSYRRVPPPS
jgi:hypothetical protein